MAKILITGSADGLGQLSAKFLIESGHQVILHARNDDRAQVAIERNPGAAGFITGDFSTLEGAVKASKQANALGVFDAVIHNAGVFQAAAKDIFHVNVFSPFVLTSLMEKPKRFVYLSSMLHAQATSRLNDLKNVNDITYAESKLYVLMLAKAVARLWPDVLSNAVHPGWVPTKLGGSGAPDDLQKGAETQSWLTVSEGSQAKVSGQYFFHKQSIQSSRLSDDITLQNELLDLCSAFTNIDFPVSKSTWKN